MRTLEEKGEASESKSGLGGFVSRLFGLGEAVSKLAELKGSEGQKIEIKAKRGEEFAFRGKSVGCLGQQFLYRYQANLFGYS